MKLLRAVTLILTSVMFLSSSYAAEAELSQELDGDKSPSIVSIDDMDDLLDDYLSEKGKVLGVNYKKNGSEYLLASGTSIINAPRNSPSYIDSRANAFDKALLQAKGEMLGFLGSTISQQVSLAAMENYSEGELENVVQAEEEPGIWDKSQMLLNAKLDELLKEKGIDPEAEQAAVEAEIKEIIESSEFQKSVVSTSQSMLTGVQPFKILESSPENEKGEIGVIIVWSDKLAAMASSIVTGIAPKIGKSKKPIKEQFPDSVLMGNFGVKQVRDENGDYYLVAFGQSGARSTTKQGKKSAKRKAKLQAESYLRAFAGENATRSESMLEAESTQTLDDNAEMYQNTSSVEAVFTSRSTAMKIVGMTALKRWSAPHPLTGQQVYGHVLLWSPKSAGMAKGMKHSMANQKKKKLETKDNQKGKYSGESSDTDEEDF